MCAAAIRNVIRSTVGCPAMAASSFAVSAALMRTTAASFYVGLAARYNARNRSPMASGGESVWVSSFMLPAMCCPPGIVSVQARRRRGVR